MNLMEHQKQFEFLRDKFEAGQLAHAYILTGRNTETIKDVAKDFVKLIHCLKPNGQKKSCGECDHCRMIGKGIFTDSKIVSSRQSDSSVKNEKDMLSIEIDQIRDVQDFLVLKPYYNGYKTVVIEDADRMTAEAQNCFLKTLEEPQGKTLILLLSKTLELLLPTITSRCQEVRFQDSTSPKVREAYLSEDFLRVVNGNLAEKFAYTKNVNLEGEVFSNLLINLSRHMRGRLLTKLGVIEGVETSPLETLKNNTRFIDDIYRQSMTNNLNTKLALEVILLELS